MSRNENTYKIAISLMTPARPEEVETLLEGLAVRNITVTLEEMIDLLRAGADGDFTTLYKGWCKVLNGAVERLKLKDLGPFVVKEVAWLDLSTSLPEAMFPYLLHDEGDGTFTEWDDPSEVHGGESAWIVDV